jgi:hypothetical protein
MKKIYIAILFFMIITALYTGCRKQEPVITQNNDDVTEDSIINEESAPVIEEEKTIQETIEDYGFWSALERTRRGRVAFQIEGNFTGSGNKEIVAFYYRHNFDYDFLCAALCFVLDTNEEKVEKVYNVNWWGTIVSDKDEMEIVPGIEDSGRQIIYEDIRIGYVGDFNGNGKEELYLLSISGMNRQPYFLEFDETEFVRLLDIGIVEVYIDSVDIEEKIITIRIYYGTDVPSVPSMEKNSYIWNNDTRLYVLLNTKEYRWNINTRQYEEITE